MEVKDIYVGQRVLVNPYTNRNWWAAGIHDSLELPQEGTVKGIFDTDGIVNIEFDVNFGGHSCGGISKEGHGWNFSFIDVGQFEDVSFTEDTIDFTDFFEEVMTNAI